MSSLASGPTPEKDLSDADQKKLLEEAKNVVQVQGFLMKRALDNDKLMEALKHASQMLAELRTGLLSPKHYYALYILTSDQLSHLEIHLSKNTHGKSLNEIYELVQYAGNILPRLYLLVTVGSVYIKTKAAPAKEVLKDLVEMCRGVQHPTRGLFLRTYLSEMTKDKLPETGSEYEAAGGGDVRDSVDFILTNFIEMNKLWVRLQHHGQVREREKRERERKELSTLVGKNLSRLSQLEGVDPKMYKEMILPKVLEQIVQCRDVIAQQYLMDILIQVFSDDFHLTTLQSLLKACARMENGVDIKSIVASLVDRLINYLQTSEVKPTQNVFNLFWKYGIKIIETRREMPLEHVLAIQVALQNLALKCYPEKLEYVDQCLKFSADRITASREGNTTAALPRLVLEQAMKLLNIPLEAFKNVLRVLQLQNYSTLIDSLDFDNRRRIAIALIKSCLDNATVIPDLDSCEKILALLKPLLSDATDQRDVDPEDFAEEQNLVAQLLHLFRGPDIEQMFGMLVTIRKAFTAGGPKRRVFTHPPLCFSALRLVQVMLKNAEADSDWAKKARKVITFAYELVNQLDESDSPRLVLSLYLQTAQQASECKFDNFAYECFAKAFTVYEDKIADSKEQYDAIRLIIATLRSMHCFDEENYEVLVTKTAQHSSRLMKKPDQCRAVAMCSHLFWVQEGEKPFKDAKRVFECLLKASKIADATVDTDINVVLFVEILNEYLFYFEENPDAATVKRINQLISHIKANFLDSEEARAKNEGLVAHFKNTMAQLNLKKKNGDARYEGIEPVAV